MLRGQDIQSSEPIRDKNFDPKKNHHGMDFLTRKMKIFFVKLYKFTCKSFLMIITIHWRNHNTITLVFGLTLSADREQKIKNNKNC